MESTGPLTSDPVLLTDLAKGELFFIRLRGVPEAQLAIRMSGPTDDPIYIKYGPSNYRLRTYFYQSEAPTLETFRVHPPNYTSPFFEKIREQLFPRRLGSSIDEREVLRRGLGQKYYFKEDSNSYVLGTLVHMTISQFGDIDLMYREEPSEDFPEGRPRRRNYSPGYLNPYIWTYREHIPSRLNILKQGEAIMERNGPEGGMATMKYHLGKAGIHERAPLIKFYYNKLNAERKKWEKEEAKRAAASGGGGGGANANNTTKGGVRRTGRFRAKRRQTRKKN